MTIRFIGCVAAAFVLATVLGCKAGRDADAPETRAPGELRVLVSTYPIYLFTLNVTAGRDSARVESMLPASMGCPHDYSLTPEDMRKIARADVFVVNGLGMEEYLGAGIQEANPRLRIIDTSEGIKDVLKMTPEEGGGEAGEEHHHHDEINPHLFASPRTAAEVARNIASGLSKLDPAGAEVYRKNADAFAERLEKLADDFAATGKTFASRRIVTEHAVFDYLARDCGLEIVSVVEEAPGQEPSGAQMLEIVNKIRSSGAAAVFTEPQYPAKVGETIAKEAKVPVALLDPVATGPDNPPLDYYEQTMRKNLVVLKETLSKR